MRDTRLDPERLAASLFLFSPDEAYEVALEFLNGSLSIQDRDQAMIWTTVLTLVEQMQSDYQSEPSFIPEMRSASVM